MIKHFIMIPLTGVGIPGFRGNDWYRERIEIFKRTTLKSLLNQENKNFIIWITCRPEEENNPLTLELGKHLYNLNLEYIFTFNGLMYWDDKFSPDFWSRFKNVARVIRWGWRNKTLNISLWQVFQDKNRNLEERLGRSLRSVGDRYLTYDWVYLTRLDSDDMLHRLAVREIQEVDPHVGALVYRNGYIYNGTEVAEYKPKTNPPFHTLLFPGDIFWRSDLHLNYYGDFRSHEDIPKLFRTKTLPDGRYCVGINDPKVHISTRFDHPFRGKIVSIDIMKGFGL